MTEYSISEAFRRIEAELIQSIMDNLDKHRAQETAEGLDWEMWQVLQLKELEKYRKRNAKKFDNRFDELNEQIAELFTEAQDRGMEEANVLRDILLGDFKEPSYGVNTEKVDALIKATVNDMKKAEHAVLRKANDEYRKIIFNAQAYMAQGGTYEKAVDMATRDFIRNGIQSIVYKNGARHQISDYARMALRTGNKRAYLMGLGEQMKRMGVHTVRVNRRSGACPYCARWLGKVLVDDVYGGGTKAEAKAKGLPLLSQAISEGFLHPNCKDVYSIYIEGVSEEVKPYTKKERLKLSETYSLEQQLERSKGIAESYKRLADNALDESMREKYRVLQNKWEEKVKALEEQV